MRDDGLKAESIHYVLSLLIFLQNNAPTPASSMPWEMEYPRLSLFLFLFLSNGSNTATSWCNSSGVAFVGAETLDFLGDD